MADDPVDKTIEFTDTDESNENHLEHQDGFADKLNGDHDSGRTPIEHRADDGEDDEYSVGPLGKTATHHRDDTRKDEEFGRRESDRDDATDEDPHMTLSPWTETDEDDEDDEEEGAQ